MFTGIIEEVGRIARLEQHAAGAKLRIAAQQVLTDATEGCSIAVNGVCLTALELAPDGFSADLAPETLNRTSLGQLGVGSPVNLERPLLPTTRLSGHIVQGHVDATGEVAEIRELGDGNWWLEVRFPAHLGRYFVEKGSVSLDGISLTIAALHEDRLAVAIIPHTWTHTNLSSKQVGDRINLEVDVIAKHVERMMAAR